jgi:SAM-dependent methyltransferase
LEQERAVCDYEGTSYRARFWDGRGREYEDLAERIALKKLLPPRGRRIIELGAGFGRLADFYKEYDEVILLDYAKSGLREAQERLGRSAKFKYVAADIYHLPLAAGSFDTAVTVRVLHHLVDVPVVLRGIWRILQPGGVYVVEYANKRNIKAAGRYLFRRQRWSPFARDPYEFAHLNFDFHPSWMASKLRGAGFAVVAGRAVSHFRQDFIKRLVPPSVLAAADGRAQRIGAAWKLSPSIFLRCERRGAGPVEYGSALACPKCDGQTSETQTRVTCVACGDAWNIDDGIYDFKTSNV